MSLFLSPSVFTLTNTLSAAVMNEESNGGRAISTSLLPTTNSGGEVGSTGSPVGKPKQREGIFTITKSDVCVIQGTL